MANSPERGRTNITTALQNDLKKAHEDKPMSMLPRFGQTIRRTTCQYILQKGTQKEKEAVYEILSASMQAKRIVGQD
uniref:type IX secretion component PorD family protein n=1 Tax=Prevotella intermedia TaxID=28131 RepID=UPI001FCB35BB|nr:DUF4835 family protein [Prevotella intermedia]